MEIQRDREVAIVRLHGGKANAIDGAFLLRLVQLFDEVESCDARAAVVTGYDSYFSAGLALPSLLGLERSELRSFMRLFESSMRRVFACRLPVVAAVNGHAIAGGCVLALQCDLRLIADGPIKIGLNEVQLGIGLPPSVIEPLRCQLPPSSFVPVAFQGTLFTPAEAKHLGLVEDVVPSFELIGRAVERARGLALGSREAVAQIKLALRRPILQTMEQSGGEELDSWLETWYSATAQERLTKAVARIAQPRQK